MFEYELDGEVLQFTQEEVDKRAKEKGLTTEDYLTQHPEVKPVNVEKTNDAATQGAPVASETTAPESTELSSVDFSLGLKNKIDKVDKYEGTSFIKGNYNIGQRIYQLKQEEDFEKSLETKQPNQDLVNAVTALSSSYSGEVVSIGEDIIDLYEKDDIPSALGLINELDKSKRSIVSDYLKEKRGFDLFSFENSMVQIPEVEVGKDPGFVGPPEFNYTPTTSDIINYRISTINEESESTIRAWGNEYFKLDDYDAWVKENKGSMQSRTQNRFTKIQLQREDKEEYIKQQGGDAAWELYQAFDPNFEGDYTGNIDLKDLLANGKIDKETVMNSVRAARFEKAQIEISKELGNQNPAGQIDLLRQLQIAGQDVGEAVYQKAFNELFDGYEISLAASLGTDVIDKNSAEDFIKVYNFAKAQERVSKDSKYNFEIAPGYLLRKIQEVKSNGLNRIVEEVEASTKVIEEDLKIIEKNTNTVVKIQEDLLNQIDALENIENPTSAQIIQRNNLIGQYQANSTYLELNATFDIAEVFNKINANRELEVDIINTQFERGELSEEAYSTALAKNYNNWDRASANIENSLIGGYEATFARLGNLFGVDEDKTLSRLIDQQESFEQAFANKILYSLENFSASFGMGIADNASTYLNGILMFTPLSKLAYLNYFAQGAGGSILEQERAQRNATSTIPILKQKISEETNEQELWRLNRQLEQQNNALNTNTFQRNATALISGFADMVMERFLGQGLIARNFAKWSKVGANATFIQKAMGTGKAYGISFLTELPEETSVQLINNFTNRTLLNRDISLFDGLDGQFVGDVFLGAGGMSTIGTAKNSYNGVKNIFITRKEKQTFQIKFDAIAKIDNQLKSPNISAEKKEELLALKVQKIKEMFYDSSRVIQKAESLTADQIEQIGELDRKRHKAKQEIINQAYSGEYGENMSNTDKSILQDAKDQYDQLNEQIEAIADTETKNHEEEASKAVNNPEKKNTKSEAELVYEQGIASFHNSAAKALSKKKGSGYTEVSEDQLTDEFFAQVQQDNDLSDEDINKLKQKIAAGDNAAFVDDGKKGNIYVFTTNQQLNILLGTGLEGKIAAVAGLHEVLHKENRDQGIIKDGEVVEAAKIGIESLDSLMKIKFERGKITKEAYDTYVNRKKAYDNDAQDNSADYEEVLNLVGDLVAVGAIKRSDFNMLFGIKNFLNKTLAITPLGKRLNTFIDFSDNDTIFSYISSFNKAAYENRILRGGVTREEEAKDIKTSKEASDAVQRIYEEQGASGAFDIFEQFKPITTRIARRFRDVPGYDEQLIIDEIETGKRGIFDLIREYKPESGVPLAAYINKFLPARSIEAGNRILKTEFEEDVAEARGVAAEETAEDTVAVPERRARAKVLADELNITDKVASEVSEAQIDISALTNFKSVPNAVINTVGEMLGISPAKIKSKANLTKSEVANAQRWFNKNVQLVIDSLPQGFDAEGQATGVPRTVLQALYTQKETRAKTKAGLRGQVKRTNIKDSEFLELIDIIDGKPTRDRNTSARIIALADLLGKTITNQEIRKQNPEILKIRDGMSKVMFSKGNEKSKESGDIDLNKIEGKEKQKAWLSSGGFAVLPKSFWLKNGQLVGSGAVYKNVVIDGKKVKEYEINEGERIAARKMLFANVDQLKDFIREYERNGGTFAPENDNVKAAIKRTTAYGKKTAKQVQDQINKNKDLFDKSDKGFIDVWMAIQKDIQDNPSNRKHWAALLEVTSTTQANWMRVASRLVGGNTLGLVNVEEHMSPATDFAQYLWEMAKINKLTPSVLRKAMKSFTQISLPEVYDKLLKGKDFDYTKNLPLEYKFEILAGIMPSWVRYINPSVNEQVHYINGVKYQGMNPNVLTLDKGQTLAQEYGVDVDVKYSMNQDAISIQQDILFRLFTNQITKSEATSELNARIKVVEILQETKQVRDNKKSLSDSIINARPSKVYSSKSVGMSTFDFDETLIIDGENFVTATKEGQTIQIPSDKWPIDGPRYAAEGWNFDFSDFVNVRGGKEGPLLQKMKNQIKKYGNKNVFVLTARMQEAAEPIHKWLKSKGINIPIENITGLGKSEGDAKAQWFIEKYAEGYNDMYFVDDALPNVKAVKHVFDQLDIKGKSVQAKIKFSKGLSIDFNKMLERTKGVGAEKIFSRIGAQKRGKNVGRFTFFVPPSADDFAGLLRYFVGKGEQGNKDLEFFNKVLIKPFARADRDMKEARQSILDDHKALRKALPQVAKKLGNMIDDSGFTFDNAIRVYLWDKAGFDIPGLSKRDIAFLTNVVRTDQDLRSYADTISLISKQDEGYIEPSEYWDTESIAADLQNVVNKQGRKKFLAEWKENVDVIFSPENLNKIEATYGSNFREALENILWRMENGTNRAKGMGRIESAWNNWVNNSVGAIMFFNARSAVLQTLSTVNFINFEDNNIFAAAKAFANQKQYWKDFSFLFNSDFLKQRRAGLQTNINEAEIANAVAGATNKAKAALQYLLKKGFLPTQIADSFAIASGGATYYRNRIKKYVKEGMSQSEAEAQAMEDFMEIAEETQQSARPDRISQQQASSLGRIILAFANTPMQYARLIKKAAGDLRNKRGDWRSNVSRIIYYGVVQGIIFSALQNAIFALAFDDEEPEKDEIETKVSRTLNGMIDSLLRGSGLAGAVVSTIKNAIQEFEEQKEKKGRADYAYVLTEALNLSPPIGSKARKLYQGGLKTYEYNGDVMGEFDTFDLENPLWTIIGNVVSATTNIPLDRGFRKIDNIKEALNQDNQTWQRIGVALGWDQWNLGIDPYKDIKEAEKKLKEKKKEEKKKNQQRCTKIKSDGRRCKIMVNKPKTRCHYHD